MKRILITVLASTMLLLAACVPFLELGRDSAGAADPGDGTGWRDAKLGDIMDFQVMIDWPFRVTDYGSYIYILVPELEEQGNASFLLVEILSDSETSKEYAESDMLFAEEDEYANVETVSHGPVKLGDLPGYEWIFNQWLDVGEDEPFSFTRYFLYVEEAYLYRFSFGVACALPENFNELYDEFKERLVRANSDN